VLCSISLSYGAYGASLVPHCGLYIAMSWTSSERVVRLVTDLRTLKREVLTGLASWLAGTSVSGVSPRIRRNPDALRITWDFANGVRGLLFVGTLKQGLPTGAFALEPRLIVTGGPLVDALAQVDLPPAPVWESNHYLVNADCHALGGPTSTYVVRQRDAAGVVKAREDIERMLMPAMEAFSGNWAAALDLTMRSPQAVAFAGAVAAILMAWTGQMDRFTELVRQANQEPWLLAGLSPVELEGLDVPAPTDPLTHSGAEADQ